MLAAGTLANAHWWLAPTHRRFELNVAVIYELDPAGQIIAERSDFDKNELLESMGLIVSMKTALGRLLLIPPQSSIHAIPSALRTITDRGRGATSSATRPFRHTWTS